MMTDTELLDRTHAAGLTVVSSVPSRRAYLVPLNLADDTPALRTFIQIEDAQPDYEHAVQQ